MKKIRFLLFALILSSSVSYFAIAQVPGWTWANLAQPTSTDNELVATDLNGNAFTTPNRVFTKYSPNGTQLWSKHLPSVRVKSLKCDKWGNIYLGGFFNGTIQIDSITLVPNRNSDIFLAKFKSNGNVLWAQKAGGSGPPSGTTLPIGYAPETIFDIAVDSLGNCFATGVCLSDTAQFGSIKHFSNYKHFVAKYDSTGNALWVRNLDRIPVGIATGLNGSFFITGNHHDSNTGQYSVYIDKYSGPGSLAWRKEAIGRQEARDITSDRQGNCYVTGVLKENTSFDGAPLTVAFASEMFLVKYSSSGLVYYVQQSHTNSSPGNTTNLCLGSGVAIDGQGYVVVSGGFTGNVTFSGSPISISSSGNGPDIYVAKFTPSGSRYFAVTAGSPWEDFSHAVSAASNGDSYIVGTNKPNCAFGNVVLTGTGNNTTAFLAKLSANPLSIPEAETAAIFQLYPNPAATEVTISAEDINKGTINVFNLTGQKIYEAALQPEMKLHVANWPAGIYAVKVTSGSKNVTRKLVVTY